MTPKARQPFSYLCSSNRESPCSKCKYNVNSKYFLQLITYNELVILLIKLLTQLLNPEEYIDVENTLVTCDGNLVVALSQGSTDMKFTYDKMICKCLVFDWMANLCAGEPMQQSFRNIVTVLVFSDSSQGIVNGLSMILSHFYSQ